MEVLERERVIELFDLYGNLLTDKQRDYITHLYFYDLSYTEVAEIFSVSRNGVFDQSKKAIDKLIDFEDKLHLLEKINKIDEILKDTKYYDEVLEIIKEWFYGIWIFKWKIR